MPQPEWIETALFIHGIMCDESPGSHDPAYDGLFDLIQKALKKKGKPLLDPSPIKVEWGWNSGQSTENDRFLSDVERIIHDRTSEIEKTSGDFSILRPVHLLARQIMIFGFGDLFYYISKDGEQAVRCQVFQTLCNQIAERKARYKKSNLSLTIIAHSAGTIIAHDLLYHLFRKSNKKSEGGEAVRQVRGMVQNGELRIRKFYSMGSPITPMIIRSDSLLIRLINNQKLDPEGIGLRQDDGLPNPRWVNFWDQDDVAAFPVEFLYANENQVIRDQYLDLGDVFPPVHGKYWTSPELARCVAETF